MTTLDAIRVLLFAVGSLVSIVVSWRALLRVRSHGFYRFFAWEAILALIALNLPQWLSRPFSARQLGSWSLLAISMVPLVLGVGRLRKAQRAEDRPDGDLYNLERTAQLVDTGIYRYLRHPIYACLFYLTWGAFLKHVTWPAAALAVLASVALLATALVEEKECTEYFGPPYQDYMKRTKRFIPFVF